MLALSSFDYAVLRVVPRVDREEFVNAGVILFCLERKFLEARVHVDETRCTRFGPISMPLLFAKGCELSPR